MSKTPATTNASIEGIISTLANTVSALLQSKGAIAVIAIIALVAFAIGYLSGRPFAFKSGAPDYNLQFAPSNPKA